MALENVFQVKINTDLINIKKHIVNMDLPIIKKGAAKFIPIKDIPK